MFTTIQPCQTRDIRPNFVQNILRVTFYHVSRLSFNDRQEEKEKEEENNQEKVRQFRRVRRDKKTGVPSKYLTGARNRSAKAKEIKDTAEKYKKGQYIDIQAISKLRSQQDDTDKKKKTSKSGRRKKS